MSVWRGIARLAAVAPVFAVFLLAAAPDHVQAADGWRITNLDPSARIHLRQRANSRSKVLAYIPGDARGLKGGPCADGWCQVEFKGVRGWVFARYLTPERGASRQQQAALAPEAVAPEAPSSFAEKRPLSIARHDTGPIAVYAFPNDKLPVAGRLAQSTTTVEGLGSCIREFCYIRSGTLVGWVKSDMLSAEAEGDTEEEVAAAAPEPQEPAEDVPSTLSEPAMAGESPALNSTVPTASQTPVRSAMLLRELGNIETRSYALAGLGPNALAIREKPDDVSAILGWIPASAKDVEGLRQCVERWCLVRHNTVSGWVARRHLADVSVESSQTFQVKGVDFWGALDVLDYPHAEGAVVGKIPNYATGIVPIGGCDEDWCHIRYLGIAGWVKGAHLEPQGR